MPGSSYGYMYVYRLARFPGDSFTQRLYVVSNCSGCGKLGVIGHCSMTCVYFAVGVGIYETRFNLACLESVCKLRVNTLSSLSTKLQLPVGL